MRGVVASTIAVALLVWVIGSGFWLMSGTEYPYMRTVGGAVLVVAGIWAAIVGAVYFIDKTEGGKRR